LENIIETDSKQMDYKDVKLIKLAKCSMADFGISLDEAYGSAKYKNSCILKVYLMMYS
jgi:hypothetical protein